MLNLDALKTESPIMWGKSSDDSSAYYDCIIADQMVAWIEPRPSYCDRGHWKMNCELPDLDAADRFPRYYMNLNRAKEETEDFLRWRLWKIRAPVV